MRMYQHAGGGAGGGETSCKQTSGRTESSLKDAGEKLHRAMGVPGENEREREIEQICANVDADFGSHRCLGSKRSVL